MGRYIECKRLEKKVLISDEAIPYTKEAIQSLIDSGFLKTDRYKPVMEDLGWLCECGEWTGLDKKNHRVRCGAGLS